MIVKNTLSGDPEFFPKRGRTNRGAEEKDTGSSIKNVEDDRSPLTPAPSTLRQAQGSGQALSHGGERELMSEHVTETEGRT